MRPAVHTAGRWPGVAALGAAAALAAAPLAAAPLLESRCSARPAGTALVDAPFRDAALQALQRLAVRAPGRPAHGAVRNHLGAGHVDSQGQAWHQVSAYAVNLGLLGALAVSPDVLPLVADWLQWQSGQVATSGPHAGVVADHWVRVRDLELALCPPGMAAERCGDVDAVDSTAASTLLVADAYLRHGGSAALLRDPVVRALLESAAAAMTSLTGSDGLTLAKRNHAVVYTMDTVEVVAGWRAWARLQRQAYAQPQSAVNTEAMATLAENSLHNRLWDAQAGAWRVHLGAPALQRHRWYPDTMAQAWPLLWGSDTGVPERAAQAWRLAQQHWRNPHWSQRNPDPAGFWWPAAAVAAQCTGDEASARAWVARARQRWLDPRNPFPWPFQISDLLWLLWMAEPQAPRAPGVALAPASPPSPPPPGEVR